jgi:hypothetical protein
MEIAPWCRRGKHAFKVLRHYPTKADATGPLPTTLTRYIKKGWSASVVELLPGRTGHVKGDVIMRYDDPRSRDGVSSVPRYYVIYYNHRGMVDGGPVALKPHQYRRAMSYQ